MARTPPRKAAERVSGDFAGGDALRWRGAPGAFPAGCGLDAGRAANQSASVLTCVGRRFLEKLLKSAAYARNIVFDLLSILFSYCFPGVILWVRQIVPRPWINPCNRTS
ncbi:hypothetical protein [Aminobacter sp. MSH1]|uniref:hypothetical protein n=1 Tax=Aminobacter sp. MSH1 TaxID=374606 RepID=UPI00131EE3E1|nr:hypothetical protein [Aminobacter sp. MSH1]